MSININAIETCMDILEYMMAEEIRCVTIEDDHIGIRELCDTWMAINKGLSHKGSPAIQLLQRQSSGY